MSWIYDLSLTKAELVVSLLFIGIAWAAFFLVYGLTRKRRHLLSNVVAERLHSSVGILFSLLLGLVAVAAHKNLSAVEAIVGKEVASLDALHQEVSVYPEPHGESLSWLLRDYVRYVIKAEWPIQQRGGVPVDGAPYIHGFHERLLSFEPKTNTESIMHAAALSEFEKVREYRTERLQSVRTIIPGIMWYVVLFGSALSLFSLLLLEVHFVPHFVAVTLFAFFLASVITLIAEMDHPFRGALGVKSSVFEPVYQRMRE